MLKFVSFYSGMGKYIRVACLSKIYVWETEGTARSKTAGLISFSVFCGFCGGFGALPGISESRMVYAFLK